MQLWNCSRFDGEMMGECASDKCLTNVMVQKKCPLGGDAIKSDKISEKIKNIERENSGFISVLLN